MKTIAGRYSCGALLMCALMALSSCETEQPGGLMPVEDLATEATNRVCGILEACCNDAAFNYDAQGCQALYRPGIMQRFAFQVFFGSALDEQAAKRCLDSIGQVSDGCPVDGVGGYLTNACDWLFKGTVPLGGKCDATHGCASSPLAPLFCEREYDSKSSTYASSGVCVSLGPPPYSRASAGEACSATCIGDDKNICIGSSTNAACYTGDGLFCNGESKQCEPQAVTGEPCKDSYQCAAGSYCNVEESKCAPISPLGASCSKGAECGQNACIAGSCQRRPRASAELCVGKVPPPPLN